MEPCKVAQPHIEIYTLKKMLFKNRNFMQIDHAMRTYKKAAKDLVKSLLLWLSIIRKSTKPN